MSDVNLVLRQCSQHGFKAFFVENDSGGTRVAGGKCCGTWDVLVFQRRMTSHDLRAAAQEFLVLATDLDAAAEAKAKEGGRG